MTRIVAVPTTILFHHLFGRRCFFCPATFSSVSPTIFSTPLPRATHLAVHFSSSPSHRGSLHDRCLQGGHKPGLSSTVFFFLLHSPTQLICPRRIGKNLSQPNSGSRPPDAPCRLSERCTGKELWRMGGVSYPRRRFANAAPLVRQTSKSGKRAWPRRRRHRPTARAIFSRPSPPHSRTHAHPECRSQLKGEHEVV